MRPQGPCRTVTSCSEGLFWKHTNRMQSQDSWSLSFSIFHMPGSMPGTLAFQTSSSSNGGRRC